MMASNILCCMNNIHTKADFSGYRRENSFQNYTVQFPDRGYREYTLFCEMGFRPRNETRFSMKIRR